MGFLGSMISYWHAGNALLYILLLIISLHFSNFRFWKSRVLLGKLLRDGPLDHNYLAVQLHVVFSPLLGSQCGPVLQGGVLRGLTGRYDAEPLLKSALFF